MPNLNYSQIARKSFQVKFTFEKPVKFDKFVELHKKLSAALANERISYLDTDFETHELSEEVSHLKKDLPEIKNFSEGLVYFSEIGSFDNWLRKFKHIVVETLKNNNISVTEVYVNGGEYVTDPKAWFPIPELDS